MSCNSNNPCNEPTCNDCSPINSCYENCGCLNPTTWECIDNPGNKTSINVVNQDNGLQVLDKINSKFEEIGNEIGLVKVESNSSCLKPLYELIEAGTNIAVTVIGTGCDQRLVITGGVGVGPAGADVNVKVSSSDTVSDFLYNKILNGVFVKKNIQNAGSNEKIILDVDVPSLLSIDSGNQLTLGLDGKLKTSYVAPDGSETKLSQGSNVSITGNGTINNPYVISVPLSIFRKRTSFDGEWKPLSFSTNSNPALSIVSQNAFYRIIYNGTIEFKGNITYNINFTSGTGNKISTNVAVIPTGGVNNLAAIEIDRGVELKNIMSFDLPTNINQSPNLIGYTIKMLSGGNINVDFMSNTSGSKTLVLNLDGAQYHPNI